MHPMERLRSVARATDAGTGLLVREAAGALAGLGPDPAALVTACRRLIGRHPSQGPLWWLAARVLCAADPVAEAWRAAADLDADGTTAALAAALPDSATVVLIGWPEQAVEAVRRRGDVTVLLVSSDGKSTGLSRRLRRSDVEVDDVSDAGMAAAVATADLVVLEPTAVGPERMAAAPGSAAAAAVARSAGVPVWVLAGVGRVLPQPLWTALDEALAQPGDPPWERPDEVVNLSSCDVVVGPGGARAAGTQPTEAACPVPPELLKPLA